MLEKRKQDILKFLKNNEYVRISDLAERCNVSPVTMRKDIAQLESMGLVNKYHGKAAIVDHGATPCIPYIMREDANLYSKELLAKRAIELIEPNDTIILDAGSTAAQIARQLLDVKTPINIVTNSVPILATLQDSPHMLSMAGGVLLGKSQCTVGPDAEAYFNRIQANKVFLGCTGIREGVGLTTGIILEAAVKRAMLNVSKEVIAVFDSSKFKQTALNLFAKYDEIDTIITMRPEDMTEVERILSLFPVKIIFADEE